MMKKRVLVFDPAPGGHHAEYFFLVLRAVCEELPPKEVVAVTSRELVQCMRGECGSEPSGVTLDLCDPLPRATSRVAIARKHWAEYKRLGQIIERHRPSHVFLPYLDGFQLGLSIGMRFNWPLRISGIFFRPWVLEDAPRRVLGRIGYFVKKRLPLWSAAWNRHLDVVFVHDPRAIDWLVKTGVRCRSICDPVEVGAVEPDAIERVRRDLASNGRRIFAIVGAISERKGVIQVMDGFLGMKDHELEQLSLIIAGECDPVLSPLITAKAEQLMGRRLRVLLALRRLSPSECQTMLTASDFALLAYQKHVGSSAILIRAAAAGKPVISQDYGLLGWQTRNRKLGVTVDSSSPGKIREAMRTMVRGKDHAFDVEGMQRFALENSPSVFVEKIRDYYRE